MKERSHKAHTVVALKSTLSHSLFHTPAPPVGRRMQSHFTLFEAIGIMELVTLLIHLTFVATCKGQGHRQSHAQ